jgi:c-di-GMP-binding flagellar brake protein YcgR
MSKPSPNKKTPGFTEVKDSPSATILVHSRTVVEKKDFVSTGIMTFAEGDMLEVEISDYSRFDLGESVKLTVYTPVGIFVINSTIIGKDIGSLLIINPPENQRRFAEKREFPRVDVDRSGTMASMALSGRDKRHVFDEPVPFQLKNISLGGIGFSIASDIQLDNSAEIEMELDIGLIIPCVAEIVRRERENELVYYGARYVKVAEDKLNSIRAFILREQIAAHSATKRLEDKKRLFK